MNTSKEHLALWEAINAYVQACGGDSGIATVCDRRIEAVASIGRALDDLQSSPHDLREHVRKVFAPEVAAAESVARAIAKRRCGWYVSFPFPHEVALAVRAGLITPDSHRYPHGDVQWVLTEDGKRLLDLLNGT